MFGLESITDISKTFDRVTNSGKSFLKKEQDNIINSITNSIAHGKLPPISDIANSVKKDANQFYSDITKMYTDELGNFTRSTGDLLKGTPLAGLVEKSQGLPTIFSNSSNNKKAYAAAKDTIPCYIINLVTNSKIEFECTPESVSDNNSAQFDSQEIRGRSSPYQGYSGSGPRSLSYNIVLHEDLCKEGLINTINKLKALTYPEYGGVLLTPKCLIRLGNMIHCQATVSDVSITYQKPHRDNIYVYAEVDLSFSEVVDKPYSASEIEVKGGFL